MELISPHFQDLRIALKLSFNIFLTGLSREDFSFQENLYMHTYTQSMPNYPENNFFNLT